MNQEQATAKVTLIRSKTTDTDLALLLGICKVTLYKRLKSSKWKKTELALINTLKIPK